MTRVEQLERVLRDVLSIIDTMGASDSEAHAAFTYEDMDPEDEERMDRELDTHGANCFGPFSQWGQFQKDSAGYDAHAVVCWPDLRLAADEIRKVLGS